MIDKCIVEYLINNNADEKWSDAYQKLLDEVTFAKEIIQDASNNYMDLLLSYDKVNSIQDVFDSLYDKYFWDIIQEYPLKDDKASIVLTSDVIREEILINENIKKDSIIATLYEEGPHGGEFLYFYYRTIKDAIPVLSEISIINLFARNDEVLEKNEANELLEQGRHMLIKSNLLLHKTELFNSVEIETLQNCLSKNEISIHLQSVGDKVKDIVVEYEAEFFDEFNENWFDFDLNNEEHWKWALSYMPVIDV